MKPKKDFLLVLDQVKGIVYQVQPKHMDLPTPDSEWSVRQLLAHMLYELSWVADIVMGEAIDDVAKRYDGDLFQGDALQAWRMAAISAREAVHRCDPEVVVHLSYGDTSCRHYLQEATTDQLVHAWDLAQAIDVPFVIHEVLAAEMFERLQPKRAELLASGLYKKPVHVPADATYTVKLLALLGRSENWRKRQDLGAYN